MKKRPLAGVSDFVVEQMPNLLLSNKSKMSRDAGITLDAISDKTVNDVLISAQRQLAALDLKMLENALVHSELEVPSRLTALIDLFSGEDLKALTYEEIIMVNPEDDLRMFSTGKTKDTERTFYSNHRVIEDILSDVILQVISVVERQDVSLFDCKMLSERLNSVTRLTAQLAKMPEHEFLYFRKYLASHPTRILNGPSGAYSARIPSLELLTFGDSLPAERFDYLRSNWQYFPTRDHLSLANAMNYAENSNTLQSLAVIHQNRSDYQEAVSLVRKFFTSFRKVHYHAVKKQVPGALEGKVSGTGGEVDVHAFLTGRMK